MTKRPTTVRKYAEYLYQADQFNGLLQPAMTDSATIEMRVRAFIDGANWAKRQARKRKTMTDAWMTRRKKYGPSGQSPSALKRS